MRIERCPFCGGGCIEAVETGFSVQMQCEDCAARGPSVPDEGDPYEKVIRAWNHRKTLELAEELIQFAAVHLGGAGTDVAEFERKLRAYYATTASKERGNP